MEGDEEFLPELFDVPHRTRAEPSTQTALTARTFLTACWVPQNNGQEDMFLEMPTLLDEGAGASFMAWSYFNKHRDEIKYTDINIGSQRFSNVSGTEVKVRGTIRLGLHLAPGHEAVRALLLLADLDPRGPAIILGQPTLHTLGHVRDNTSPFYMAVHFNSTGYTHVVQKTSGVVTVMKTAEARRLLERARAPRQPPPPLPPEATTGQGVAAVTATGHLTEAERKARHDATVSDFGDWRTKVTRRPTRQQWREKLAHVNQEFFNEAVDLVCEFEDVWYLSGYLPPLDERFKFDMELKPDAPENIRKYPYPVSREDRDLLNDQVDGEIAGGMVREVLEGEAIRYCSSCFFKCEGLKLRRLTDYRDVNKATEHTAYGVPHLGDILSSLSGGAFYLQLDVKSAYTQLLLTEKAQKLLTFVIKGRNGKPRYLVPLRATFGATDLPSHYSQITALFDELDERIRSYLDDINAKAQTMRGALDLLRSILKLARELGLQLSFKKANLFVTEVKCLGMVLDIKGRRPDPERVKALVEWRCPSTSAEVRQFLGVYTYIAGSLHRAVDANVRVLHRAAVGGQTGLDERPDFIAAFQATRDKAAEEVLLTPYDPSVGVRLTTDSSAAAMGAVLEQKQPGEDDWRVVFLFSRAWPEVAARYPAHDLESTAVVAALKRFRALLHCRSVHIVTDCVTALRMLTETPMESLTAKLQRQRMYLDSTYDVTIEHKVAKYTVVPDALSRQAIYRRARRLQEAEGLYGEEGDTQGGLLAAIFNEVLLPAREIHDRDAELECRQLLESGPGEKGNFALAASLATQGRYLETDVAGLGTDLSLAAIFGGGDEAEELPSDEIYGSPWLMQLRKEQREDPDALDIINKLKRKQSVAAEVEEHESVGTATVQGATAPTSAKEKLNDKYGTKAAIPRVDYSITRNGVEGILIRRGAVSGAVWHAYWIPQSMRSDLLALVHGDPDHNGTDRHPGVAKMLLLMRDQYYWPKMHADVKAYVSSCRICQLSKRHATPKAGNYSVRVATALFETVSVDLMDFARSPSRGNRYLLVVQDLYSRFIFLIPLKNKEAATVADAFWERVATLVGPPDTALMDNGGEFKGVFRKLLDKLGSGSTLGLAYHPQSNAANERSHKDIALLLRASSNEAPELWADAVPITQYLMNTKVLGNSFITPYDLMFGTRPRPLDNGMHGPRVADPGETHEKFLERARHQRARWSELMRWERRRRDRLQRLRDPVFKVGDSVLNTRYSSFNNKLRFQVAGPYLVLQRDLAKSLYNLRSLRTGRLTQAKGNTLAHYLTNQDRVTLLTPTTPTSTPTPTPTPQSTTTAAGGEQGMQPTTAATAADKDGDINMSEAQGQHGEEIQLTEGNLILVHDAMEAGNFELGRVQRQGDDEDLITVQWYASRDKGSRKEPAMWRWAPSYVKTRSGLRTLTAAGRGVEPDLAELPRSRVLCTFEDLDDGRLPPLALNAYERARKESEGLGLSTTLGNRGLS